MSFLSKSFFPLSWIIKSVCENWNHENLSSAAVPQISRDSSVWKSFDINGYFLQGSTKMCAVLATCRSDEKSTANNRENILVWENNHKGHLNDLGLSLYIRHKYFLQRPILLPMLSTHLQQHSAPFTLLSLCLSAILLCPTTRHWVFNPVVSNNNDHWINTFRKELFSFLKVAPTQKCTLGSYNILD